MMRQGWLACGQAPDMAIRCERLGASKGERAVFAGRRGGTSGLSAFGAARRRGPPGAEALAKADFVSGPRSGLGKALLAEVEKAAIRKILIVIDRGGGEAVSFISGIRGSRVQENYPGLWRYDEEE